MRTPAPPDSFSTRRITAKRQKSAASSNHAADARRALVKGRVGAPSAVHGAIELALDGGCLTATLAAPTIGNRISRRMGAELMDLAETVEDDDSILALAITGADKTFCAGFEYDVDRRLVETLAAIAKPTVAILNGDASDEGLELALALDLRVGLADSRYALTQLERGELPHFGGTQRLPRLIGAAEALRMLLTGAPLSAAEAMRLGLITYLAQDRDELAMVARDLLATLAERSPLGLRMVKDAVRKGYDMTVEQGVRLEEDLYALLQTTADRAEGVRAFLEKRKPLFKGS
ncbi:MAG TPA: enoyl-CoA hydratase/isomerase family protein [Candidatus Binataceae bacterium]|nr:enoyl-CoA hydratase/isomerase family protein [Candidatus Binataceae bacterium]